MQMAKPIKETPVLTGKDAREFTKKTNFNESANIKVPRSDLERARKAFANLTVI